MVRNLSAAFGLGVLLACSGMSSAGMRGSLYLPVAKARAVPEILIIQRRVETNRLGDPNLEMGDFMAQELQDNGRGSPIVWAMTDAIFRAMVSDGKVSGTVTNPSLLEAEDLAKRMHFDYVLVLEAHADSGTILARAELFKGEKQVWQDPGGTAILNPALLETLMKKGQIGQLEVDKITELHGYKQFSISNSTGLDKFNSLRSIAHTWAAQIGEGPLSGVAAQVVQPTPTALPGQISKLIETVPQIPKVADNTQVFAEADQAVRDNRPEDAVLILRDAVDAEPFDLPRREALIKLLNDMHLSDLAAAEAARAATLAPSSGEGFHLESAQALLTAGNLTQARSQANEALARNPKDADAQLVLGEVSVREYNYPTAIQQLTSVIALKPTCAAYYYRSLARALTGDTAGQKADSATGHQLSLATAVPPYSTLLPIMDKVASGLFVGVRDLLPSLALGSKPGNLSDQLTAIEKQAAGAASFLDAWPPGEKNAPSHDRRVLALKLLVQTCDEALAFLKSRDDDTLTDARINLGEAMKQYKAASDLYASENLS